MKVIRIDNRIINLEDVSFIQKSPVTDGTFVIQVFMKRESSMYRVYRKTEAEVDELMDTMFEAMSAAE